MAPACFYQHLHSFSIYQLIEEFLFIFTLYSIHSFLLSTQCTCYKELSSEGNRLHKHHIILVAETIDNIYYAKVV